MPNQKTKSKKRRRIILGTVVILIVGAIGGFLGFKRGEPPVLVEAGRVERRNITETVVANGRIYPVIQVVINPEVSGEIVDLPVKEGQEVKKGDLLVRIKPDNYIASRNSAEAHYKAALAGTSLAEANLRMAELEFARIQQLHENKLVSDSQFLEAKTSLDVAKANHEASVHQAAQAKASLDRAEDDLSKTTILAPMDGTVTKLRSEKGERVVGTAMMAGTEIMTIANLEQMEARVDLGEIDIVLIKPGQKAELEVEAFRDRKFKGVVTEIANAANGMTATQGMTQQQEATKFEVKILIQEKEAFRPGMTVTAEIQTRERTNVLAVPFMAVTVRTPKEAAAAEKPGPPPPPGNRPGNREEEEKPKPEEVVFLVKGDTAKKAVVETGISDDTYIEITEGLQEGQEIIVGGYAAISRELEDGKKIQIETEEERRRRERERREQG